MGLEVLKADDTRTEQYDFRNKGNLSVMFKILIPVDGSSAAERAMRYAILGNTTNYWIGRYVGPQMFRSNTSRLFKREYLERTQRFYQRHGGKTIVITRFVPIVRTFAPFVAGVGRMGHLRFQAYNIAGGLLWVVGLVLAGYWFGDMPLVQNNLTAVIFLIISLSILPGLVEYVRHRRRAASRRERLLPPE